MKLYQKGAKEGLPSSLFFALIVNFFGATFFWALQGFPRLTITGYSLVLMILHASLCITVCLLGLIALKYCNLSVYALFSTIGGMIFPFIVGAIFQPEKNVLSATKILGIILLPTFLILRLIFDSIEKSKNLSIIDKTKEKQNTLIQFGLCLIILCLTGLTNVVSSFQSNPINGYTSVSSTQFTIVKQYIGTVICLIVLAIVFLSGKGKSQNKEVIKSAVKPKTLIFTLINAVVASAGGIIGLEANKTIPTIIQYPVATGGAIVVNTIISILVFKGKESKSSLIFIVLCALSSILFVI